MTTLPAYCPRCRSIFPFNGIDFPPGMTIQMSGNMVNCPVCGNHEARISDGVYRATQEAVEVLSGPDSTRAMVEAFKLIAERLKAGEISQPEAVKAAEAISLKYATIISTFGQFGMPGMTLLVTLIGLYLTYAASQSSSEDAKKIVDAIAQQTFVMQDIARKQKSNSGPQHRAEPKAGSKPPTLKSPSERRAQVKKERRATLKQRRVGFGGARSH